MRRNLFLYLTLACFFGIVAIFIGDGYMGIYDSLYVATGERTEKIDADFWLNQSRNAAPGMESTYYLSSNRDRQVSFTYEVDNRLFSSYTANVEVTIWHNQQKVRDVVTQPLSVAAFDKGQVEWVINNAEFLPGDLLAEQSYEYTVVIKKGETERKIIISVYPNIYPSSSSIKPVPVPVPPR